MKRHIRMILLLVAALGMALLLGGCAPDGLYTLPKTSEEYQQLQDTLNEVLATGAEYSAPTAGTNRQTVQLEDLDSDGTKEAIAFFNFSGEDEPLKIYIYRNVDGTYQKAAEIQGEGTNIESISYVDMDGDGVMELVVGWQVSADLKMLTVYSLKDFQVAQLAATDYTRYTTAEMNHAKGADVVVLRFATPGIGEALMLSLQSDGEMTTASARMTDGVAAVSRVRTGMLSDGTMGVYVEGTAKDGSLITDIFACQNEQLYNVVATAAALSSTLPAPTTMRTLTIYSQDINDDGMLEVPFPVSRDDGAGGSFWLIEWYAYSGSGQRAYVETTYHDTTDGWFYVIPRSWEDTVRIRRDDEVAGEHTIYFSDYDASAGTTRDFLAVYTLSGTSRADRSALEGRFVLKESGDVIYAAELLGSAGIQGFTLGQQTVENNFNIIYSEWETGES